MKRLLGKYDLNVPKEVVELKVYDNSKIKSLGVITLKCERDGNFYKINFQVVKENVSSVIGFSDAQRLNFLKIMVNDNPCSKQEVKEFPHQSKKMCRDKILNEFPDLFQGLGELGPPCKISIDSTVTPVIHAPRKVPLNLQKKLKAQLDSMEGTVIEKVTEPTDWVSSMVLVTKPKSKDSRI